MIIKYTVAVLRMLNYEKPSGLMIKTADFFLFLWNGSLNDYSAFNQYCRLKCQFLNKKSKLLHKMCFYILYHEGYFVI